ncbi:MAG: hypothetical protein ACK5LO_00500 [Leucobacter sp.]
MSITEKPDLLAGMTSEAWVALLVGVPSLLLAVAAIIVSVRANKRAKDANTLAEKSNGLASEANTIATEAVEHQKLTAPPAWGAVQPVSGKRLWYGVENRSGRDINVLEFTVMPTDSAGAVTFRQEPGEIVGYGDSLFFSIDKTIADDPRQIEVAWVYADRTEEETEWNYLYRALIW